ARIEAGRLAEIRDGTVIIVCRVAGETAIGITPRKAGIEPDRRRIIRDRAIEVLLGVISIATAVYGRDAVWFVGNRLVVVGDGRRIVLARIIGGAPIHPDAPVLWIARGG